MPDVREPYSVRGSRMRETVFEQARSLSSGTLGSLSHQTRYDVIDRVQWDFMDFCSEFGDRYEVWQDAWNIYILTGRLDRVIANTGKSEGEE